MLFYAPCCLLFTNRFLLRRPFFAPFCLLGNLLSLLSSGYSFFKPLAADCNLLGRELLEVSIVLRRKKVNRVRAATATIKHYLAGPKPEHQKKAPRSMPASSNHESKQAFFSARTCWFRRATLVAPLSLVFFAYPSWVVVVPFLATFTLRCFASLRLCCLAGLR